MHLIKNIGLIRADVAELGARSKALKRRLRRPWTGPMADVQRELCQLKRRITELCALRALSRGKLHFRNRPPASPREARRPKALRAHFHCQSPERCHARIAERLGPSYGMIQMVQEASG